MTKPLILSFCLLAATPLMAQDAPAAPASAKATVADSLAATDALPQDAETRAVSVAALQATLYDLIAMKHTAHQEHWNVVGIEYYQLHEFYGEIYTAIDPLIDVTAERIPALGVNADGRTSAVAATSPIQEPDPSFTSDVDTLNLLMRNWKAESDALYTRLDETQDDVPTQDLLTDVTRVIDHQLWQIRAHLQSAAGDE